MADNTSTPQAGAAPAAPPTPGEALSTASKVEQLADRLSACADAIHERVMRDIHRYPNGVPPAEQAIARALFDSEQELRERAERLYAEAAACIVSSLGQSQQHVIQITADAAAKIQAITRLGDGVSLVARVLGVAAAALTGQGIALMVALNGLQAQLALISAHNPPAPPAAPPAA